jgi:hypothetical protein
MFVMFGFVIAMDILSRLVNLGLNYINGVFGLLVCYVNDTDST